MRRGAGQAAARLAAARRGFTLLEVMVALALLAGALMATFDLIGRALANHAHARELTAATLLARGKLAELTEKYEDQGFKDFDEDEEGDFAAEGRPQHRWRLELVKPDGDLTSDQLFAALSGGGDPQALLEQLMGGGAPAAGSAAGGPTTTASANPLAGAMTALLQMQLTSFGEAVKKSLREARLTVSWPEGKRRGSFTVTTHLLVLNPRAPGGARGDDPEIPADLAAAAAAASAAGTRQGARQRQGTQATQGTQP